MNKEIMQDVREWISNRVDGEKQLENALLNKIEIELSF